MELWNQKNLQAPPTYTCRSTIKEIDVKLLSIAVKDGLHFFENQKQLHAEAALISRLIYRMKMKMRSSKDFKSIERLSHLLRSYLQLNIASVLRTISTSIPNFYQVNQTYILTKNMLDYALVRLQGLGRLLARTLENCQLAFTLTHQKLRIGHFWKLTFICYAAIARIFVITRKMLKYTCELYEKLVHYSPILRNAGVGWLPEDYVLPEKLNKWLDIDWVDLDREIIEVEDEETPFEKLMEGFGDDDDDVQFCDEYILVRDDSFCDLTEDPSVMVLEDEGVESKGKERKYEDGSDNLCNVPGGDDDVGEIVDLSESPYKMHLKVEKDDRSKKKRKRLMDGRPQNSIKEEAIEFNGLESPKKKKQKLKNAEQSALNKHREEDFIGDKAGDFAFNFKTEIVDDPVIAQVKKEPKREETQTLEKETKKMKSTKRKAKMSESNSGQKKKKRTSSIETQVKLKTKNKQYTKGEVVKTPTKKPGKKRKMKPKPTDQVIPTLKKKKKRKQRPALSPMHKQTLTPVKDPEKTGFDTNIPAVIKWLTKKPKQSPKKAKKKPRQQSSHN